MSDETSSQVMGWDQFLKHSGRSSGGDFLEAWKDDGQVDVWLVPSAGVANRWTHRFWTVGKQKNKDGDEVDAIRYMRWVCHEPESILKKQKFRTDDGDRKFPPVRCPYDLVLEHVRDMVRAGKLDWTAKLFQWKLPDDELTVLAGGFCGLFSMPKDRYSEQDLRELRSAGVDRSEAYKVNGYPKLDYLIRVVDAGDPGTGIVIAPVADALGSKIQKEIGKRIVATKGAYNPARDPLCLRWMYDESKDFSDKYDVVTLYEEEPSKEVLAALGGSAPSMDELIAPGSAKELREAMQKACLVQLPWDELFGSAEEADDKRPKGEPWDAARAAARSQAQAPAQPAPTQPAAPQEPDDRVFDKDGVELVGCEVCQKTMRVTDTTCTHCGAKYNGYTGALEFDPRTAPKAPAPPTPPAQAAPAAAGPPPARRARRAAHT